MLVKKFSANNGRGQGTHRRVVQYSGSLSPIGQKKVMERPSDIPGRRLKERNLAVAVEALRMEAVHL